MTRFWDGDHSFRLRWACKASCHLSLRRPFVSSHLPLWLLGLQTTHIHFSFRFWRVKRWCSLCLVNAFNCWTNPQHQHKLLWISTPLASVNISVGIWTPFLLAAFLSSPSHSHPVFFPSFSLGIRVVSHSWIASGDPFSNLKGCPYLVSLLWPQCTENILTLAW